MKTICGKISVKGYAKVNLFLDITGVLPNGYHALNTVMQQLELADDVIIAASRGDGISVFCDNPLIPTDGRNIAFKAAESFLKATGCRARILIDIKKRIPTEAGLGGSSADGAAVLNGLNFLAGNPLTAAQLCALGGKLGADVPFCILGGTMLCTGAGDVMKPLATPENVFFVIIKPEYSYNTKAAYALYDCGEKPAQADFSAFLSSLGEGKAFTKRLYNVFERLYADKRTAEIETELVRAGALGTCMTGSGSAVFGVFDELEKAKSAQNNLPFTMKFLSKPLQGIEMPLQL